MTAIILGQSKRLRATFRDSDGALVDPTIVSLRLKSPAGTVTILVYGTDVALVQASTGIYYYDLLLNASGLWYWRWVSSGVASGASQGQIDVAEAFV